MNLSRKQREIVQRHDLFLDIANSVLAEEGFHMLTMERIAELAEYSKGTVYQHFTCKEEILIQLCNAHMSSLHELFNRAIQFDGSHRDRMLAVFYANLIWADAHNKCVDMQQHLHMHGVLDKVTEASLSRHKELENGIFGMVTSIVTDAITAGDLPKNKNMTPPNIVFGLWSLCTGGQLLRFSELPLADFGIKNPGESLLRMATVALDGVQWQPVQTEAQFKKLVQKFEKELFAEEHASLNQSCKD